MIVEFYVYDKTSGEVVRTGSVHEESLALQAATGEVVAQGHACIETDWVDVTTRKIIAKSGANCTVKVRIERGRRLIIAGQELAELMLPDSYPNLTSSQKQTAIDSLLVYRQALRDITKQKDHANIVWPTPPA